MTPQRQARLKNVLDKRQPDITVLLENIHDPHNISAVMRTCDAIGVNEIYILNHTIQPHTKFGRRSSSGALKWLTINQFTDVTICMQTIKAKYSKIYATYLHADSKSLYDLPLTESICLVFGNEHGGITPDVLPYCDGNFIIPQVGMIQSLNISVACAISLYEAYRQKLLAGHYEGSRMPTNEYDQQMKQWVAYTTGETN
jgi:tRNA (guanosine-2'-O-)-methyltransferase